jgi:arylsulfatase
LRERGEFDRTLVIFLSDNGGAAENPNRSMPGATLGSRDSYAGYDLPERMSRALHSACTRFSLTKAASPRRASFAGRAWYRQAGAITSEPAHLIDLLPTFLHAAGTPPPAKWRDQPAVPLEGRNLSPVLAGGSLPERLLFGSTKVIALCEAALGSS